MSAAAACAGIISCTSLTLSKQCLAACCSVLPGAEVLKGIDSQVQAQVASMGWAEHGHHGFNPTMLSYLGLDYVVVRAGNLTFCPGARHVEPQEREEGLEEPGGDDPAPSQFDTKARRPAAAPPSQHGVLSS